MMTKLLRSVFEQIVTSMEKIAEAKAASSRMYPFTPARGHCPHCGERTEWQASVLHRFYFCMQCKRDPKLSPNHYEAAVREAGSQGLDLDRSNRRVVEPEDHQEGNKEMAPA